MTKSLFITLIHSSCVILCSLIASIPGLAQITADGTTSTTVTSPDGNNFTIDDGDSGGNNLFHSFRDFSVPTNGSASFNNAVDIKNIFSRVTGGNISSIDGLIRANGSANLFLINPAGIIFGRNARLDIGGSFLGSTADSILFPEGEFNTVDLDNPPLLTINAPIGLGFRDNPGDIVNQAPASNGNGLEVSPGKNITLVGGDIKLAGGDIFAPGGRVELGGLSTAGEIGINADGSLSFPESVARADVTLTNSADINVRAGGGGSITINARNINLDGELGRTALRTGIATDLGSTNAQAGDITLNAEDTISLSQRSRISNQVSPTGMGNAGEIKITTKNLSLTQGGVISASTFGQGDAGAITIDATGTILVEGDTINSIRSGIFSRVAQSGQGNSGGIEITTTDLFLTQGGQVITGTFGQGNAGAITINASNTISVDGASQTEFLSGIFSGVAPTAVGNSGGIKITTSNLSLTQGGQLDASTFGQGNAGEITINAANTISADGASQIGFFSGIFSGVAESGVGNSGGIKITTSNLSLTQGGTINASTFGQGDAGTINIDASNTISVKADSLRGIFGGILSRVAPTGIGNAGGIKITTSNLSLTQGGGVSASTFGQGDAGTITINASDTIFVDGDSRKFSSGIYSRVAESAVGNSGGIKITTSNLSLLNDALITVQSGGEGNAGKLDIRAKSLRLENGASLLASTPVGTGGSITLQIADNLILREHSTISARATNDANGGNITIDADLIIAALNQNNDIIASAERGTGGKIDITAAGIFGLEERSSTPPNNTNDIDSSSQFGLDGSISIKIPDTGVLGEEIETPKIVEPKTLGTNACSGGGINANMSSFEITGKGGIAPTPTKPLTADALVIGGQSSPVGIAQARRLQQQEIKPIVTAQGLIYPARGIIFKENGDIILTAYPTPNVISRTPSKSVNCS